MASVPVQINGVVARRDKSEDPYPVTVVGWASIPGLSVGGGPIIPPDQLPDLPDPPPPLVIWGGGNEPFPTPPIYLPPDLPPVNPPNPIPAPHEGWNYSQAKNGWYHLYIPGPGEAGPKV